jgi:hypothetical protein
MNKENIKNELALRLQSKAKEIYFEFGKGSEYFCKIELLGTNYIYTVSGHGIGNNSYTLSTFDQLIDVVLADSIRFAGHIFYKSTM